MLGVQQTQLAFWSDPIALEFVLGLGVGCARRAGWRIGPLAAAALAVAGVVLVGCNFSTLAAPEAARFLRFGFPAAMLVGAAALGPSLPSGRAANAATLLGDASYALYLSHPFVIRPMREAFRLLGGSEWPSLLFPVVAASAGIAAALILHKRVETPLNVALRRLCEPMRSKKEPGAGATAHGLPAA